MNNFEFGTYRKEIISDIQLILNKIDSISEDTTTEIYIVKAKTYYNDNVLIKPPISASNKIELRNVLSETIYHHYYKRRQNEANFNNNNFADNLEQLVKPNKRFFGGWQVDTPLANENGSIIVGKNLYYRKEVFIGNFITQELTFPVAKDNRVLVRGRQDIKNEENTSIAPSEGKERVAYSFFFSKFIPDDDKIDETYVRFYFNLDSKINAFEFKLASFINFLREQLNLRYIPFIFKVLNNYIKFTNADTAVLYIEKRYFCAIIDLIQLEIPTVFKDLFRIERPMFTYRVAEGIGFSEQPFQNHLTLELLSFGKDRSLLIADSIVENLANNDWKNINKIIKTIETNNQIQIKELFLNSNKSKEYYPEISSKTKNVSINNQTSLNKLTKIAILAGNKLCSEAIWDRHNRCTWITINELKNYETVDNSLTNGLAGVVFFLEKLKKNDKPVFGRYFDGAMKCLKIKLYDKTFYHNGIIRHGFHLGELMSFYILKKYGKLYIESSKAKLFETKEILDSLNRAKVDNYTVENGLAGTIISLLYLFALECDILYLNKAVELGKQLLSKCSNVRGYVHPEAKNIGLPLGASGIGITLLLLKIALKKANCQDTNFLQLLEIIGMEAINFENTFKSDGFWKNDINDSTPSLDWRDGTIGILLSRIILLSINPSNDAWKNDFYDAFKSLLQFKQYNYDVYSELKRCAIFNPDLAECYLNANQDISSSMTGSLYETLKNDNLKIDNTLLSRSGHDNQNPLIGFSPTLQNGFAGLGYTALRLLDPNLPSILIPNTEFSL